MNPVMTPRQGRRGEASQVAANAPTCLQTTLYDTIAALQGAVEPAEDDLVVAIVVRWLRTRRLTLVGDVPASACKEDMTMVKASSGDAAGRCPSVA